MTTNRLFPCLVLILLCAAPLGAGERPLAERLAQTAPLAGDVPADGQPVCLPLPRQIVAATSNRFADLRLFDDRGRETPYVIYGETVERRGERRFPFRVIDFEPQSQTMILERDPGQSGAYDRLELKTGARNFRKSAVVSGSDDRRTWRELGRDMVFDFSAQVDLRKTFLELAASEYRYLRLVLTDGAATTTEADITLKYQGLEFKAGGAAGQFKIDRVEGWLAAREVWEATFDQEVIANPPQRQDDRKVTWVELGEVNLPLAEVRLGVASPYFSRAVAVQAAAENKPEAFFTEASGTIYRIPGMDKAKTDLECDMPQRRWLRLRIPDGDSPPLAVESVTLRWTRQNLYFVPEPGRRYEVRFGGPGIAAPVYDLAALLPAEQAKLRALGKWRLGDIQPNPQYRPPEEPKPEGRWGTIALYAILSVLAVGLAFWLYRLARNLPPPGAAQQE